MRMETRLLDACAVLLGPQVKAHGPSYLDHLDVAVVRRAYRVLAVACHPDAARRSGVRHGANDGKRFIEASHAYELLMKYLLSRSPTPTPRPRPARPRPSPAPTRGQSSERRSAQDKRSGERRGEWEGKSTAGEKRGAGEKNGAGTAGAGARTTELFYRGQIPRRKLRLAEFLYYSGRVSWQSLINAIVWQRLEEPKFGELARELREISSQDLAKILLSKLRNEQTGQTALRLRLLSPRDVQRILILQRARHRPIGRYFVEKGGLSTEELNTIIRELYRHNARSARPPA